MEVTGASRGLVSGWLPIDALDDLIALADVHSARAPGFAVHVGDTTSQGDEAQRSDELRMPPGLDGYDVAYMYDVEGSTDHLEAEGARADPDHAGMVYADPAEALQYLYYVDAFYLAGTTSSDAEDVPHDGPGLQAALDPVTGWLLQGGWL